MPYTFDDLLADCEGRVLSSMAPSALSNTLITPATYRRCWAALVAWIQSELDASGAIHIPGLGDVFFRSYKLGIRVPQFALSHRFAAAYSVVSTLSTDRTKVACVRFNFRTAAKELGVSKSLLFTALSNLIECVGEAMAAGHAVVLDLGVGTLVSDNRYVALQFHQRADDPSSTTPAVTSGRGSHLPPSSRPGSMFTLPASGTFSLRMTRPPTPPDGAAPSKPRDRGSATNSSSAWRVSPSRRGRGWGQTTRGAPVLRARDPATDQLSFTSPARAGGRPPAQKHPLAATPPPEGTRRRFLMPSPSPIRQVVQRGNRPTPAPRTTAATATATAITTLTPPISILLTPAQLSRLQFPAVLNRFSRTLCSPVLYSADVGSHGVVNRIAVLYSPAAQLLVLSTRSKSLTWRPATAASPDGPMSASVSASGSGSGSGSAAGLGSAGVSTGLVKAATPRGLAPNEMLASPRALEESAKEAAIRHATMTSGAASSGSSPKSATLPALPRAPWRRNFSHQPEFQPPTFVQPSPPASVLSPRPAARSAARQEMLARRAAAASAHVELVSPRHDIVRDAAAATDADSRPESAALTHTAREGSQVLSLASVMHTPIPSASRRRRVTGRGGPLLDDVIDSQDAGQNSGDMLASFLNAQLPAPQYDDAAAVPPPASPSASGLPTAATPPPPGVDVLSWPDTPAATPSSSGSTTAHESHVRVSHYRDFGVDPALPAPDTPDPMLFLTGASTAGGLTGSLTALGPSSAVTAPTAVVPPIREALLDNIMTLLPPAPKTRAGVAVANATLASEMKLVRAEYVRSARHAVLDYVLRDAGERDRLRIHTGTPVVADRRVDWGWGAETIVTDPPPAWKGRVADARDTIAATLHVTRPVVRHLVADWQSTTDAGAKFLLIDLPSTEIDALERHWTPVSVEAFEATQLEHVSTMKLRILSEWHARAVTIVAEHATEIGMPEFGADPSNTDVDAAAAGPGAGPSSTHPSPSLDMMLGVGISAGAGAGGNGANGAAGLGTLAAVRSAATSPNLFGGSGVLAEGTADGTPALTTTTTATTPTPTTTGPSTVLATVDALLGSHVRSIINHSIKTLLRVFLRYAVRRQRNSLKELVARSRKRIRDAIEAARSIDELRLRKRRLQAEQAQAASNAKHQAQQEIVARREAMLLRRLEAKETRPGDAIHVKKEMLQLAAQSDAGQPAPAVTIPSPRRRQLQAEAGVSPGSNGGGMTPSSAASAGVLSSTNAIAASSVGDTEEEGGVPAVAVTLSSLPPTVDVSAFYPDDRDNVLRSGRDGDDLVDPQLLEMGLGLAIGRDLATHLRVDDLAPVPEPTDGSAAPPAVAASAASPLSADTAATATATATATANDDRLNVPVHFASGPYSNPVTARRRPLFVIHLSSEEVEDTDVGATSLRPGVARKVASFAPAFTAAAAYTVETVPDEDDDRISLGSAGFGSIQFCFRPSASEVEAATARVFDAVLDASTNVPTITPPAPAKLAATDSPSGMSPVGSPAGVGSPTSPSQSQSRVSPPPLAAAAASASAPGDHHHHHHHGPNPAGTVPTYLPAVHSTEPAMAFARKTIRSIVRRNMQDAAAALELYAPFEFLLTEEHRLADFLAANPPLDACEKILSQYRDAESDLKNGVLEELPLDLVLIDCTEMNAALAATTRSLTKKVLAYISRWCTDLSLGLVQQFKTIAGHLLNRPTDSVELVKGEAYFDTLAEDELPALERKAQHCHTLLETLFRHDFPIATDTLHAVHTMFEWLHKMDGLLQSASHLLTGARNKMELTLRRARDNIRTDMTALGVEVDEFKTQVELAQLSSNCEQASRMWVQLDSADQAVAEVHMEEETLGWSTTDFVLVAANRKALTPYFTLWHTAKDFDIKLTRWTKGLVFALDAQEVAADVDLVWRTMTKLTVQLAHESPAAAAIAAQVITKVDGFRKHLPLLHVVCNKGMQERHWKQVSDVVNFHIRPDGSSDLTKLLDLGLDDYIEQLAAIAEAATREHSIDTGLQAMTAAWATLEFGLKPYKESDAWIITGASVDEIQALVEEHHIRTQTMRGSPYAEPFLVQLDSHLAFLDALDSILRVWLVVQGSWMYLERIFRSKDIRRQMPPEAAKFEVVDKNWRNVVAAVAAQPACPAVVDVPELLPRLQEAAALLDDIHAGLLAYLERKRLVFPRFFFLTNDELLDILAETDEPQRVQPQLKKLFEGIARLEFLEDDSIVAMESSEGERVPLASAVSTVEAQGRVEKWLLQVEAAMQETVHSVLRTAINDHRLSARKDWILRWPAQVILAANQVMWTYDVEQALGGRGTPATASASSTPPRGPQPPEAAAATTAAATTAAAAATSPSRSFSPTSTPSRPSLAAYCASLNDHLNVVVNLVRTDPELRVTLSPLIVVDVHNRDIAETLLAEGASSTSAFSWVSQLRYYWVDTTVRVRMLAADLEYAYEYLGNSSRLVITPLTDRCYRTLMGAIHLQYGGAPEGPAGTGKTETVKDLAKALARQCIVFNCSEGIDHLSMAKFFKGLAATGAWSCFDEFNRIQIEVLSVIAQQIATIQQAIAAHMTSFVFEGTRLKLKLTASVFITMNPGYAGRTELPDNLKSLFRAVAMMVPDYAMIAEILLYSCGFRTARPLAKKVVATFKLCSEQLSVQPHYDYGMRAVAAVLRAAASLKAASPSHDEAALVLRAICDVNLPKFLAQDLPLFKAIISDLFPQLKMDAAEYGPLTDAIKLAAAALGLQATDTVLTKVLQTYETLLVRHGFMLVGDTYAGKTSCLKMLAMALTHCAATGTLPCPLHPHHELPVNLYTINPKALTMGQLYGQFDSVSNEWTNGALARVFRACTTAVSAYAPPSAAAAPEGGGTTALTPTAGAAAGSAAGDGAGGGGISLGAVGAVDLYIVSDFDGKARMEPTLTGDAGLVNTPLDADFPDADVFKRRWMVFDGPVDAMWIESLNTTLDDTKKLCLTNGEIIHMVPTMSMIFEPMSLAAASPATVSRCGMVYLQSQPTSWTLLVDSWMMALPDVVCESSNAAVLREMFDWLLPPALKFITTTAAGHSVVPVADVNTVASTASLLRLLDFLFAHHLPVYSFTSAARAVTGTASGAPAPASRTPRAARQQQRRSVISGSVVGGGGAAAGAGGKAAAVLRSFPGVQDSEVHVWLEAMFLFALTWSVGANLDVEGRRRFDSWLRYALNGELEGLPRRRRVALSFPLSGTAYDFMFQRQPRPTWVNWSVMVDSSPVVSPSTPLDAIMVPTTDTRRCQYHLDAALMSGYHLLLVGETGTGKSRLVAERLVSLAAGTAQLTHDADDDTVIPAMLRRRGGAGGAGGAGSGSAAASASASASATGAGAAPTVPLTPVSEAGGAGDDTPLGPATFHEILVSLSANTSAMELQDTIGTRLRRRRHGVIGPPPNGIACVFVDDLNMPDIEEYGAQPPLELLRQVLDHEGWFSKSNLQWTGLENLLVVGAMAPPGRGRNRVSSRLLRHMLVMGMPPADDAILIRIFSVITKAIMQRQHYAPELAVVARQLVMASLQVYQRVLRDLRPTPTKAHYVFSVRDLSRVFQGLSMVKGSALGSDVGKLVRLWAHEILRVFCDRLVSDADRQQVFGHVQELTHTVFSFDFGTLFRHLSCDPTGTVALKDMSKLMWGGYVAETGATDGIAPLDGAYNEVRHPDMLPPQVGLPSSPRGRMAAGGGGAGASGGGSATWLSKKGKASAAAPAPPPPLPVAHVFENHLSECNLLSTKPISLFLSEYAVEHISRVARILRMPGGHAMLVGVGGSGRAALTRLAAYVTGLKLVELVMNKAYSVDAWREDLKKLCWDAGTRGVRSVLLFSEAQAARHPSFLQDLNNLLNNGDVPGLFTKQEQADAGEKVRATAVAEHRAAMASAAAAASIGSGAGAPQDSDALAAASAASAASAAGVGGGGAGAGAGASVGSAAGGGPAVLSSIGTVQLSIAQKYGHFVRRVRRHLHIVLLFSPLGSALRRHLRSLPSLTNCCSINWFQAWPTDALTHAAKVTLGRFDPKPELVGALVDAAVYIHDSAVDLAAAYHAQQHRHCYVTPTSFLELLSVFKRLVSTRLTRIEEDRQRYVNGIDRLAQTREAVTSMKAQLEELQPVLLKHTKETEAVMKQVDSETRDVEAIRAGVAEEEAEAEAKALEARSIKLECESELMAAMPAVDAAIAALNSIKKADLVEVKSMSSPPAPVKLALEAVCLLFGVEPKRIKPDSSKPLDVVLDYWEPAKRVLLSNPKLIQTLIDYDRDNIDPKIMKKVVPFIRHPDFAPEVVRKASQAAFGISEWVRAVVKYDEVVKYVAPKKARLATAEAEYRDLLAGLREKQMELERVERHLTQLGDQLRACDERKSNLEFQVDFTNVKLQRAQQLITSVGGERERWQTLAEEQAQLATTAVGDCLLAAAVIAYLGPFTPAYRERALAAWVARLDGAGLDPMPAFDMAKVLGDPLQIRSWNLAGLPEDSLSTQNALVVSNARRWPLMIDPQGQANQWVRRMEAANNLVVTTPAHPRMMQVIEAAVEHGRPVLIEDVGEELDTELDPLLLRQVYLKNGVAYMQLGNSTIPYHRTFRLYMATSLHNPHYLPETSTKVSLLNFMITADALRQQQLELVVRTERPHLHEEKSRLIIASASNQRQARDIEARILSLISVKSHGEILDDSSTVEALAASKVLATEIQEKQAVAARTEADIDAMRLQYRPVADTASTLFFVVDALRHINPLYQFSLEWFTPVLLDAMADADVDAGAGAGGGGGSDTAARCDAVQTAFTLLLYRRVCRSLFQHHRPLFSFMLSARLLQLATPEAVPPPHWHHLLTGGVTSEAPPPNPMSSWLGQRGWGELYRLLQLDGREVDAEAVDAVLQAYATAADPLTADVSGVWAPGFIPGPVRRLALTRAVAPHRLLSAMEQFVVAHQGPEFVEPLLYDLDAAYDDASPSTPLVFLLPGTEPLQDVTALAARHSRGLTSLSLGKGQGPIAEAAIVKACQEGSWVLLQNCHLFPSWMPELERMVGIIGRLPVAPSTGAGAAEVEGATAATPASAGVAATAFGDGSGSGSGSGSGIGGGRGVDCLTRVHPSFRLWMSTYASPSFPVLILQSSVKVTSEPASGLRANLLGSYSQDPLSDAAFLAPATHRDAFCRLVYGLCFFHAVVQERRTFGALGWNVPYAFSEADLHISLWQLRMYVTANVEDGAIPYRTLLYLIGECNYGGRVTDEWDRRTLLAVLTKYLSPAVHDDDYSFAASSFEVDAVGVDPAVYGLPATGDVASVLEHVGALPSHAPPQVFGLHPSADVVKNSLSATALCDGLLQMESDLTAEVALALVDGKKMNKKKKKTKKKAMPGEGGDGKEEDDDGEDDGGIGRRLSSLSPAERTVYQLAGTMLQRLPSDFDLAAAAVAFPQRYEEGMNTVLVQELARYNVLLGTVRDSLTGVRAALEGDAIMSAALDNVYHNLTNGKVPDVWHKVSYPSLLSLASYVDDLLARLDMFQSWLLDGPPVVFWLGGFFLTQAFLTGALQNFARRHKVAIDMLSWVTRVLDEDDARLSDQPEDGVLVTGLWLEGAVLRGSGCVLEDARAGKLFSRCPPVWLLPCRTADIPTEPHYQCPIYRTTARRGELMTTGHSTNYVMALQLPSDAPPDVWVRRGVACVLTLTD